MYTFRLRYVFILIFGIALVTTALFFAWASSVQGPAPEAVAAMQSGNGVQVTVNNWLVFEPQNATPTTGLIFYPGGRIEPRSYAPFARDIAAQGYLVVIVPVRLNLAILESNAGQAVIDAYPQIDHWAVGGHSLGGTAAAEFAEHSFDIIGLVLWAAYPDMNSELPSMRGIAVVSIYGTNDLVVPVNYIEASRELLPDDATFVAIEGGNHEQFSWYGVQSGDGEPTISHEEQQRQTVAATVALLELISQP